MSGESAGRGPKPKLVKVEHLPDDIRAAIGAYEARRGRLESLEAEIMEKVDSGQGLVVRKKHNMVSAAQTKKALARADLLKYYAQAAKKAGPAQGKVRAKREFLAAYNTGLLHGKLFEVLGEVSFPTVERWARQIRETGDPLALAPKTGDNLRGKTGIGQDAAKVVLAVALHPNAFKTSEIIRIAKRLMAQRGVADGLSDATYRRFLEDWKGRNFDYWTFYRKGEKALHDQCLPYLERDYSRIDVGDALVADGHRLNFEILNPWTGKPKRMTLILFYDFKSNYPCGWEIMPEENTQAIAAAFRRAVLALGRAPLSVYLDNGKAFGSRFFSGNLAEAGFAGLFERLGCQVIYAWPYHAQSKTVERFFSTFSEFERLLPSYTGTSIEAKPPRLNRGEKLHRRLHEKMTGNLVPTLAEIHQAIGLWFDDYARRPQRGHLKGLSPWEVFADWRERAGQPAVDPEALHYLMMSADNRTINRNGVQFRSRNYYSAELYGRKHPVLIRYDEQDLSNILIYEQSGKYICQADLVPGVHPLAGVTGDAENRRLVREQIGQKLSLLKATTIGAREMAAAVVGPETRALLEMSGLGQAPAEAGLRPAPTEDNTVDIGRIEAEVARRREESGLMNEIPEPCQSLEAELAERREAVAMVELVSAERQRYEGLILAEATGLPLEMDDAVFMRYFEDGREYQEDPEHFEGLRLAAIRRARENKKEEGHGD